MNEEKKMVALAIKHIGEEHNDLKIVALSQKPPNGYLYYYWCRCKCGNIKRYRYDQARKAGNCGLCDDFGNSNVCFLEEVRNGEKQNEN